jgi:3-oxoacyl-[acyl-carrier protein] reductase
MAVAFAEEGANLALTGRGQKDDLDAYVAAQPWASRALTVQVDVTQPRAVQDAFEETVERFGRVDVCVANAGVWPPENLPLHELGEQRVRDVISTNLLGAVWTARGFLRMLDRTGARTDGHGASLLFIGSTAGRFGERDHSDYSMSKAGMLGLVRSLKNEIPRLDPFGRVNMIEPGWTATHMARPALQDPKQVSQAVRTMAVRQIGRARDIANAAVFLSSPLLARHVSGEVLTVAGGMEGRLLWKENEVDFETVQARLADD